MSDLELDPSQVSAVICTMNSINSIEQCLMSLQEIGIGEIIVVDAKSTDGTREIADRYATMLLEDPGIGLGTARNMGIAVSTKRFILNIGSDNVMSRGSLMEMLKTLAADHLQGVGAMTVVEGNDYLARSMNAWWGTRFRQGPTSVIGTPSLFDGALLRANPFDTSRQHSDDSELCERWSAQFDARFAISSARVFEVGKNSWGEVALRCKNYGFSDNEVFKNGSATGWTLNRKLKSIAHPARVDFVEPLGRMGLRTALPTAPFLLAFTGMRYASWVKNALRSARG